MLVDIWRSQKIFAYEAMSGKPFRYRVSVSRVTDYPAVQIEVVSPGRPVTQEIEAHSISGFSIQIENTVLSRIP